MKFLTRGKLALLLAVCLFLAIPIYQSQTATVIITSASLSGRTSYADSLTTPGVFDALRLIGFSVSMETITEVTVQITLTAIDDSVLVRLEGTLDNVNWFTIVSYVNISSNGTSHLRYVGVNSLYAFRVNWVSEHGGDSSAKVAVIVKAG